MEDTVAIAVKGTEKCYLLNKFPPEVREKIFTLAVTLEEPVIPDQAKAKSNKFLWDKKQRSNDRTTGPRLLISTVPQLASVQLSRVSRQVYQEVSLAHLFYKANTNYRHHNDTTAFWACLRACSGLEELHISMPRWAILPPDNFSDNHFMADLVVAVRGLKKLSIEPEPFDTPDHWSSPITEEYRKELEQRAQKIADMLRKEASLPKEPYTQSKNFEKAVSIAGLDIDGDGRLGEDRKPGVVSSRTRGAKKRLSNIDSFGTIPSASAPKYDLVGDLAWEIDTVHASRASDDDTFGVDFLVKLRHRESSGWVYETDKSWENISVLNNFNQRAEIAEFYRHHPGSYGKEIVLSLWKVGMTKTKDGDRDRYEETQHKYRYQQVKNFELLIAKQALVAKERAEREAALEAKAAAQAKAQSTNIVKGKVRETVKTGKTKTATKAKAKVTADSKAKTTNGIC
ncbi:hypothetical protein B0O99DRAFT_672786 [Bisporella sp. PMI_857]|nr:hypothetical protein B0O99DRAFT_672786 [Bisporella sp. PMI_857]